ncbi:MAG: hypothetical protein LBR30_07120 [Clostridioides sp.]|jgi:uncharacterized membrane protein YidH (DUF202 family)|nr:hypothetical protein [Clostridioides sp.]
MENIKEYFGDIFKCLKISLPVAILLAVFGMISYTIKILFKISLEFSSIDMMLAIRNAGIKISCLGILLGVLGMIRHEKNTRDFENQEKWEKYFKKLKIVGTILFISFFSLIYFLILDLALYFFK